MAEIFISYATEDRASAKALAEVLEVRGWSVWWDRKIPLGRAFDNVIEEAISAARCLIVLWSRISVVSEWVRSEAAEGKRRGILVPVFLETVDAPLAFRLLNGADLSEWQPGKSHPELDRLTERISEILAQGSLSNRLAVLDGTQRRRSTQPERRTLLRTWLFGSIAVLLVGGLVSGAYIFGIRAERPPTQQPTTTSTLGAEATSGKASGKPAAAAPDSEASSLETALGNVTQGTGAVNAGTLGLRAFQLTDLGVHIVFIPEAQAGIFGLGTPSGAVVWRVESGTGQAAGLHAGDVVAAINDHKIESEDDLRRVLRGIGPGKSRYLIRRGEQTLTLEIDCPTCTPM
jgi:hypothetical protein